LSFLDEPDEPVRRTRNRSPRRPSTDRQTLMARRTVAVVGGLLVLILLVLLVRGCMGARNDRAVTDYVSDSTALIDESNQQSTALFDLLNGRSDVSDPVTVQNALNGFRVQSAQLVDRAEALDTPDDVKSAQDYLLEVLEFRRDGLAAIATQLRAALGDQGRAEGSDNVALAMRNFLTSDVLFETRFSPRLRDAVEQNDLTLQLPKSTFLRDTQWLDPSFVSEKVDALRAGGGGTDDEAAPGLHGNGLVATSLGGVALTPGGSSTVTLSDDTSFEVQVANQGENTETDVNVSVKVGSGDDAISLEKPLDEIAAGETKTVTIPLGEQPPTGQSVPVEVEVEAVPGEEKTDNNSATYSVIFTR
jgi:hypothetical protein